MAAIFIFLLLIAALFLGMLNAGNQIERDKEIKKMGLDLEKMIPAGKYVHGHPKLDDPIQFTLIDSDKENLLIYNENRPIENAWTPPPPEMIATIPLDKISDIVAEDSSTVERRVTLGRLAIAGVFAFALKKKKKDELAYLSIKWKQGKFQHETFFEFEGKGAMSMANKARNCLISIIE